MGSYEASVETADDRTSADPIPLVVEFGNARTGQRQRFALDDFTGGHLLHQAFAGCVHNDLFREAARRGITLSQVSVSADGGSREIHARRRGSALRSMSRVTAP